MIQKIMLLLLVTSITTASAKNGIARQRRIERHRLDSKENNLFLTAATGISGHNQALFTAKAEYSRQIKGNFYWGASLAAHLNLGSLMSYDWDGVGPSPYRNTVYQNIYKLNAMVFYRLPVIASRLYFRVGAGIGGGYHQISRREESYRGGDCVLPYFNVEAAWILRVAKGFELKFSPVLLLAPSEFSVSPIKLGPPTDATPWITDAGYSLTLGFRF